MRSAPLAASILAILGGGPACAPKPAEIAVAYAAPDCAKTFEAQAAFLAAQPGLKRAPEAGEPYDYYSSADATVSYVITRPGAGAHPAVLMQTATGGLKTTGCAWGDAKAFEKLQAYINSLSTWTHRK